MSTRNIALSTEQYEFEHRTRFFEHANCGFEHHLSTARDFEHVNCGFEHALSTAANLRQPLGFI